MIGGKMIARVVVVISQWLLKSEEEIQSRGTAIELRYFRYLR